MRLRSTAIPEVAMTVEVPVTHQTAETRFVDAFFFQEPEQVAADVDAFLA